jgi:hypothetical protein
VGISGRVMNNTGAESKSEFFVLAKALRAFKTGLLDRIALEGARDRGAGHGE